MRVFLDTNVILDVALQRPDLFAGSQRAMKMCETGGHEMFVSWHTLSNLFYILRRTQGRESTIEFLRDLLALVTVASVGQAEALEAIEFGLNDFEDALQLSAAKSCQADLILTRNLTDFGKSPAVRVTGLEEFAPPAASSSPP